MPGPLVLDLGVGPGESSLEALRAAPGRRAVGLDRSAVMARRAATRAAAAGLHLPLLRADALWLPVRTGALDGVTGHSLLYLVSDPSAALGEAARAASGSAARRGTSASISARVSGAPCTRSAS